MKYTWLLLGGLAALSLVPARGSAQVQPRPFAQWDKIEISVTAKLAPNLYVLQGSPEFDTTHPDAAGGRIAVLFGPDGVLLVDSQDQELAEKVLGAIRTFSAAPIRILVNSHIHPDHTGGNAFFGKQGPSSSRATNCAMRCCTRRPDPAPPLQCPIRPACRPSPMVSAPQAFPPSRSR